MEPHSYKYLHNIGLTEPLLEIAEADVDFYEGLADIKISDVFVSNYFDVDGNCF